MPRDQAQTETATGIEGSSLVDSLLARMTQSMRESFTTEQVAALRQAAWRSKFGTHPVDIRWTIPFIPKPIYLVVLAGPERRSLERRHNERGRFPVRKLGNLAFMAGLATIGTVLGGILFSAAFVWFLSLGT